jgi:hypothetical protein
MDRVSDLPVSLSSCGAGSMRLPTAENQNVPRECPLTDIKCDTNYMNNKQICQVFFRFSTAYPPEKTACPALLPSGSPVFKIN